MASQEEIIRELGIDHGQNMAGFSNTITNPEELGNNPEIEKMWAIKAMEHADIYFNILCSVDPKILKLNKNDDVMYEEFRKEFPDFKVDTLDEESLKSNSAKEKWRLFLKKFEHIEDFNFLTLIRIDSKDEYSEQNTTVVTRIQFYCIEAARNREGYNKEIRNNFKPKPRSLKKS